MSRDETGESTDGAPEHELEASADGEFDSAADGRGRRTVRRVLISLAVLGLVLAVVVGGGLWFLSNRYPGNIDRGSNVSQGLDEDVRPAPATPATAASAAPV